MKNIITITIALLFVFNTFAQKKYEYDKVKVNEIRMGCDCSVSAKEGDVEKYGLIKAYKSSKNVRLYGWLSYETGKPVIPFEYNEVEDFNHTLGTAIVMKKVDGKKIYGSINSTGEEVLSLKYRNLKRLREGFYSYVALDLSKSYIMKEDGGIIYTITKGSVEKTKRNIAPYFLVGRHGAYGFVNEEGKEVTPMVFYTNIDLEKITDDYIVCGAVTSNQYRYYKIGEGWLNEHTYDHAEQFDRKGQANFRRGSESGYLTKDGVEHTAFVNEEKAFEELLGSTYDAFGEEVNGYIRVKKNGLYGFVDNKGKLVVPTAYNKTFQFNEDPKIVGVDKDGKQGYINAKNEVIVPLMYDRIFEPKDGMILVGKNEKFGFYTVEGIKVTDVIFDEAESFTDGYASVAKGGTKMVLDKSGKTTILSNSSEGNKKNSIEINFAHTFNGEIRVKYMKFVHMGIVWDKYTGENRIFYSSNLYEYNFAGKSNWTIKKSQLTDIWDSKGEVRFQAISYFAGKDGEDGIMNMILAFNTYTGKAKIFKYNSDYGEFRVSSSSLKNSEYMSPKGGKVMWDCNVVYEDGEDPKFVYVKWNTLTGKNSLRDMGEDFSIDPEKDGEFMIAYDNGINNQSEYILYCTKSLRSYRKSHGWINIKENLNYTANSDANFSIDLALMNKANSDIYGSNEITAMVFDSKSLNNNVGLIGNKYQQFKRYTTLSIDKKKYADLVGEGGEIGMCLFSNTEDQRVEYLFWNKTTGKFKIFTYADHFTKFDNFEESIAVDENLLKVPAGTAANVTKGTAPVME